MTAPVDEYNIPEYRTPGFRDPKLAYARVDFQPSLRVGAEAPGFDLHDLNGGRVQLSEEVKKHHVLLVFGAITSPVTATQLPELNRMWEYFRWRGVQFFLIYGREPHPGERYPHHTSFEQKMAAARDLQQLEEIRFPVLVDSLAGSTHLAYGARPNPAFVVNRDGRLVYKAGLADPPTLRDYLNHLLLWDEAERGVVCPFQGRPMNIHWLYVEELRFQLADPAMHEKVIGRAGPRAVAEMVQSLIEPPY